MKPNNTATAVASKNANNLNNQSLSSKDENKSKSENDQNKIIPIDNLQIPKEPLEQKKQYTIEELKNKSIALDALTDKHNTIIEKTQDLDKFKVLHEESQAKISITDVNGLSFESTNPKTIAQVIQLWKENFDEAKTIIENKIRQVYSE